MQTVLLVDEKDCFAAEMKMLATKWLMGLILREQFGEEEEAEGKTVQFSTVGKTTTEKTLDPWFASETVGTFQDQDGYIRDVWKAWDLGHRLILIYIKGSQSLGS